MKNTQQLMDSKQLLARIVEAIDDLKGVETVELDIRDLSDMADYFVVTSGTSNVHVRAISEHIREMLRKDGQRHIGIEGERTAEWVLLDYGDVLVHIMLPDARAFYTLEQLWSKIDSGAPATESVASNVGSEVESDSSAAQTTVDADAAQNVNQPNQQ